MVKFANNKKNSPEDFRKVYNKEFPEKTTPYDIALSISEGLARNVLAAKVNDKGVALKGKIMPTNGYGTLVEQFRQMMRSIGFVGLFDIDFYRCKDDFFFGEINLRIGGSGYAVLKMGVNLPAMFVNSITGHPTDKWEKEIKSTATFANERICMDNWYDGYLTKKDFYHLLGSSDISFVKDADDPMPEKYFKQELTKKRIKRIIKRWLPKKKQNKR